MRIPVLINLGVAAMGLAALLSASTAEAATTCELPASAGSGRITSIYQDIPGFGNVWGTPLLGIEVSYDLSMTKQYFYTYGFMGLDDAKAKSLLQMVNTAYSTQSPVIISVNSTCTDINAFEGKNWINNWKGLTFGAVAKK